MKLCGRIVCLFNGHRRGHYVSDTATHKVYRCPRCSATWTRKVKPKPMHPGNNGAPSDGSESFRSAM